MTSNKPAEAVITGGAVGLPAAGIYKDMFDPAAPIAGCRICGRVFQTPYHRRLHNERQEGFENPKLLQFVLDLNTIWREKHTIQNHSNEEVEKFAKTGFAFTPEAANRLAPFGIIPLGNLHQEIMDGMYEADRKPDLTLLEGGD